LLHPAAIRFVIGDLSTQLREEERVKLLHVRTRTHNAQ
jgi:hypothetical protein